MEGITRLLRRIGVKSEDRRKLWLMAPVFLVCGIAESLNYNGFMTLFNQRFGSEYLPYVYAAEAVILPAEAWFMSWLAGRLSKPGLMRAMYAVMFGIVAANAMVLIGFRVSGADLRLYYPILFLSSNFVVRQQTILLWSLAVDLCPTQQAKRLMPVFVAAATLGGIAAGLITQLVNPWFGPDVVYALGPLFLLAASFNYRKAIARFLVPLTLKGTAISADEDGDPLSSFEYFRRTLKSPFLLGILGLMTVMPALYFLMEYVFLNTAHTAYPDESAFGRMFGVVTTILFTLAFLLQTVSGKLMAWLGASGMLAAISGVYVLSFAAASVFLDSAAALAAVSGGYMLTYLLIYYSAEPSYQLFYKTLPLQQRDGFRYVAQGISSFAGILLGSGLQALHTAFGWGFPALAAAGTAIAAALLLLAWGVRRAYMKELVRSVQTVGLAERELAESFREFFRNARTMASIQAMLRQPGEEAKIVALDIIGRTKDARYLPELLDSIGEDSVRVRAAALKAMNLTGADLQAMIRVAGLVEDPEPSVRVEAVRKLAQMKHLQAQAFFFLRSKLLDPHPAVAAEAVKAMYSLESAQSYEACFEVIGQILEAGGEPAVHICRVVGELQLDRFAGEVERLLDDPHPSVRVAATACLGALKRVEALPGLLGRLSAADLELQRVTAEALEAMGPEAAAPLRERLPGLPPKAWKASVRALSRLVTDEEAKGWLAEQAILKLTEQEARTLLPGAFRALGRSDLAELAEMHVLDVQATVLDGVWAVMERLADEQVVAAIRKTLASEDEETRGGGLEVLAEGVGERRLSQRLAAALQADGEGRREWEPGAAREAMAAASESTDDWWREMAAEWKRGEEKGAMMEEQGMLGRLNKVVFLKKVPFFADLSLEELGLIAEAAAEKTYPDGDFLVRRGEKHTAFYVVVEGNLELTSVSAAGWEGTLGVLGPGEVCGANSALDGSPSAVSAQAFFGDVRVLVLERDDVTRLVRLYPEIGIGLLRASLARIRLLEEMMMRFDS
ncbi:HEAT repeat domain-containing protein [Cohnella caldifontis]|uniref:HEAT repeat domain-containing protein n=1 Tax=Cohnella caldifontis TaxID=3027471 RepID=UPI0023ED0009|nr:HEAT repeat domain-containing protein [Cohnella sp. YIM B05605]